MTKIYSSSKPSPDEFLFHHGVKGMKWGVRQDRELKRIQYRQGILERSALKTKPISKEEYNSLNKTRVTLATQNSTLYRVSGRKDGKTTDITYVTNNKLDNNAYVALLAPGGNVKAKKYQITLAATRALISPSEKERVDTFIELLKDDKYRRAVEFTENDKARTAKELGLAYYRQFVQSQTFKTPLHSAYFETIRQKGYNALVDDADTGIVTKTPIIVFNSANSLSILSSRKLSKKEVDSAADTLEWR